MNFDIVLAGGTVIDGTGARGKVADVGITGDRITAVGNLGAAACGERIDCSGKVVSPGFIDIHTHYDPQILWDPDITPTSWFGVTTAVLGNCGFTIAPIRPAIHKTCIDTLVNVEAMSAAALTAGISWEFESFAEYLDAVERRKPALNIATLIGHTALRLYEMADPHTEASPEEIRRMQKNIEGAMAAGAYGFSTSKSAAQVGAGSRPVPSRAAPVSELKAFAEVLAHGQRGIIQGVIGPGLTIDDFAELARLSKRPVTWCSLHQGVDGGKHWDYSAKTAGLREQGVDMWAQMACSPVVNEFTLAQPFLLNSIPSLGRLSNLAGEERLAALSDADWQQEAEQDIAANKSRLSFSVRFDRITVSESAAHPELEGRTIEEIAAGGSPMRAMVNVARDDGLQTRFKLVMFNYDEVDVGKLLSQDSTILGLGDGGAHVTQLCDSGFPMHLLGRFCRERNDFPIEFAVWRLTGHPARVFGIPERGELRPSWYADICVFDPQTISQTPLKRLSDMPAGTERLVREPIGIEHVLVNGQFIRRAGAIRKAPGSGKVLRH